MAKKGTFSKKGPQKFHHPYSICFLSVLHQKKKTLHNFQKIGQRPIAGYIKRLD